MEPWLNNALTGFSAAAVAFFAFKYAKEQQLFVSAASANADTATPTEETTAESDDLRIKLAGEHAAELLDGAVAWSELSALMEGPELRRVTVLYCECDRDAVYERLQRKGFSALDIQFFIEPMLILSLRPTELPRLAKLPALYRPVSKELE